MSKRWIVISLVAAALVVGYLVGNRQSPVQGQEEEGLAAVALQPSRMPSEPWM